MSQSKPQRILKLEIRQRESRFQSRLFEQLEGRWEPIAEGSTSELSVLNDLAERIGKTIDSKDLHGQSSYGSAEEIGRKIFEKAFSREIRDALRSSYDGFLTLDLDPKCLGIPWELAHDGVDHLNCRFGIGRIVPDWMPGVGANARRRTLQRSSFLILSNPTGDLPASSEEGELLSEIFFENQKASVTWLNQCVDIRTTQDALQSVDLFHFCGHFKNGGGDSSALGLELTDGVLGPRELRGIGENGHALPLLVFNNGCGSGESMDGAFANAGSSLIAYFLANGSLHYVAAHSKVLDKSGLEFAKTFYVDVLNGEAIGSALRNARLKARSLTAKETHTWAQYLLYGDPTTGLFGNTVRTPEFKSVLFTRLKAESEESTTLEPLFDAFPQAMKVVDPNDNLRFVFDLPSETVRFCLHLAQGLRNKTQSRDSDFGGFAICGGEILVERSDASKEILSIDGLPVQIGESLLELAEPSQILTSRPVLDDARAVLGGFQLLDFGSVRFVEHGAYVFSEIEEPVVICEVGEDGIAPLHPPSNSDSAYRSVAPDQEQVLGWRPAVDQEIKGNPTWMLTEKLGEGGFGEVWKAENRTTGEYRVFKFCFQADRVRSLKREATLLRLIRNQLGNDARFVHVHEIFFDEPPYHLSMDYVHGLDLVKWFERFGGDDRLSEEIRLEIIAKVADALQAAHEAGVIHRDVKPTNIIVSGTPEEPEGIQVRITDFGIGQILSQPLTNTVAAIGFSDTFSRSEITSGSGSRLYMAPETQVGDQSTIKSDVYSLGVVLYQTLCCDFTEPLAVGWEENVGDPLLIEDLNGCVVRDANRRFDSAGEISRRIRALPARRLEKEAREERDRWDSRRKRLIWASSSVAAVALAITVALGYGLVQAWKAQKEAEWNLYHAQLKDVQRTLVDNPIRAREILYSVPEDLRGWEWGRLVYRTNEDRVGFGHSYRDIRIIDLTPDGEVLVTGHDSGAVRLWNAGSGEEIAHFSLSDQPPEALSIDGKHSRLAVMTKSRIYLCGLHTKEVAEIHTSGTGLVRTMHFGPAGDWLAAIQEDGKILLIDPETGATKEVDSNHNGMVTDFAFYPNGRQILTVGNDSKCHRINLANGLVEAETRFGEVPIENVIIHPNGDWGYLVVGRNLRFINLAAFEITDRVFTAKSGSGGSGVDLSPGGEMVAIASKDSILEIIKIASLDMVTELGCRGGSSSVRFALEGQFVYTLDLDRIVRKRLIKFTGSTDVDIVGHDGWSSSVIFGQSDDVLLVASDQGKLSTWDTRTGLLITSRDFSAIIQSMNLSPKRDRLSLGHADGVLSITDPSLEGKVHSWKAHQGAIHQLAFTRDGDRLLSLGADRELNIWSVETGNKLRSIRDVNEWGFALTPSEKRLFIQRADRALVEMDLTDLTTTQVYAGPDSPIRKLATL